ncbi:MAG: hypothetical protein U0232_20780 [Thermomicrobiales bacterium]
MATRAATFSQRATRTSRGRAPGGRRAHRCGVGLLAGAPGGRFPPLAVPLVGVGLILMASTSSCWPGIAPPAARSSPSPLNIAWVIASALLTHRRRRPDHRQLGRRHHRPHRRRPRHLQLYAALIAGVGYRRGASAKRRVNSSLLGTAKRIHPTHSNDISCQLSTFNPQGGNR